MNVVQDTLGVDITSAAQATLPEDPKVGGFSNNAFALAASTQLVDGHWQLASLVVDAIADWPGLVDEVGPCRDLAAPCPEQFVARLGARMFRRPLEPAETEGFVPVFDAARVAGGDFDDGARLVLTAMLMSPQFLYRLESPAPGTSSLRPLDAHELASRLSFMMWHSAPDEALMADADSAVLLQPGALEQHARRMLDDPRARRASRQYFTEWLHLDALDDIARDPKRYPELDDALVAQMKRETLDLIELVIWDEDAPVMELLTREETVVDPELAALYGLPPQSERAWVDLDGHPDRVGILTHASVLTATAHGDEASLVERGLFVLENVLCRVVEQPPAGVDTTLPKLGAQASQRDFSELRVNATTCGGCHAQIDPLGYALERYDGIGRAHDADLWGNPLSGRGTYVEPGLEPEGFADVRAFAALLRDSERVRACLIEHHLQFATGRPSGQDTCQFQRVADSLDPTEPTVRELWMAIVSDPAFRTMPAEEGAP